MPSLVAALSSGMPSPLAAVIFWAAVACCVVAQTAILRTAFARTPAPGAVPAARRAMEAAWALLPALALAGVLLATWRRLGADDPVVRRDAAQSSARGAVQ